MSTKDVFLLARQLFSFAPKLSAEAMWNWVCTKEKKLVVYEEKIRYGKKPTKSVHAIKYH